MCDHILLKFSKPLKVNHKGNTALIYLGRKKSFCFLLFYGMPFWHNPVLLLGPVLCEQPLAVPEDAPRPPVFKTYPSLPSLSFSNNIFLTRKKREEKIINVCVVVLHLNSLVQAGSPFSSAPFSSSWWRSPSGHLLWSSSSRPPTAPVSSPSVREKTLLAPLGGYEGKGPHMLGSFRSRSHRKPSGFDS